MSITSFGLDLYRRNADCRVAESCSATVCICDDDGFGILMTSLNRLYSDLCCFVAGCPGRFNTGSDTYACMA